MPLGETLLNICSDLFKPVETFSHLSTPVQTCSHLITNVHTCQTFSHLFTPVHNCSHLFTPVHTSVNMLFAQWQFLVEFSPCESHYFAILRSFSLRLHILVGLIESYPTVFGLSSCNEKKYRSFWQPILQ